MWSPLLSVRAGTVEATHPLREGTPAMVLLRHLLGDVLRRLRLRQGRPLREISASARVSLGYLSEVERGQKEPSSELLASICRALDVELSELFREVTDTLRREEKLAVRAGIGTAHARLAAAPSDGGAQVRAFPTVAA